MELTVGQQIGIYRVIRLLGKGGMGAVYEVEHTQLGVHYALKTFTLESGHVEVLKNKFLSEGKVLARLRDPHLVRVFDLNFDESTDVPYFVMDLVLAEDGAPRTLADIRTDELAEEQVRHWFGELAAALDYIHAQGIVHRDIKLGNILLSADHHVVLSDFGISRLFSDRLRTDVNAVNTIVSEACTCAPLVMGTQGYMAPEVARGETATPAADAYSLGVMFVYLLTGIWYEPGSMVMKLVETLELRWIDVLPRLLAENPADRPTNLTELVKVLSQTTSEDASARGRAIAPQPPRRSWSSRLAKVAASVVFCIGIAACFLFLKRPASPVVNNIGDAQKRPASPVDFSDAFSVCGICEPPSK